MVDILNTEWNATATTSIFDGCHLFRYQYQSINILNSRLEAHAQQHVTIQLQTMKIKIEYSANGLELVKERTSPMPTQRWQESYH